jgi:nucleotidyltransferase substrate binding protein (TIGR01987 family)
MIDISSLILAIQKLEDFLRLSTSQPSDSPFKQALDTACVQAFEYTYELSHKMLKRYLEEIEPNKEDVDSLSFQDLIRVGFERDLLKHSWQQWKIFRELRNKTSHTYNEEFVQEILAELDSFLIDVNFLKDKINERQGH